MNKINFKDKKVYIPLIVIAVLLVILLFLGISNLVSKLSNEKEEKYISNVQEVELVDELVDDVNRKEIIVSAKDNNTKCVNNICVENVKVICYENRGIIEFVVKNYSSSSSEGYLNLSIGDYSTVIWYDSVKPNGTYEGFHSYEGYNLTNVNEQKYMVREINDDDKTSISTFKNYSCLSVNDYYEYDYDDRRVFSSGDGDFSKVACISRNDPKQELKSVNIYSNPCVPDANNSEVENTICIEEDNCYPACEDLNIYE